MAFAQPLQYEVFATDSLGCVHVIRNGAIVGQFGDPHPQRRIRSASFDDSNANHPPVLALSGINGSIKLMNADGNIYYESPPEMEERRKSKTELHLFKMEQGSSRLLYCSHKRAVIGTYNYLQNSFTQNTYWDARVEKIACTAIDRDEQHCVFAGKTNGNLRLWNLQNRADIWRWISEETRNESIELSERLPYATINAVTFRDPNRNIIVAATNHSQIWTFDTRINGRAPTSIAVVDMPPGTPINALEMGNDGFVYFGTGGGRLAVADTRNQRQGRYFREQQPQSGSIRSIKKHPNHPLLASYGLDEYVRVWNVNTRTRSSLIPIGCKVTSVFFRSV